MDFDRRVYMNPKLTISFDFKGKNSLWNPLKILEMNAKAPP